VERDPDEVVVVSVMRLAARKRPVALVRAVARARAALPPGVRLRVRVAGDGPSRGAVERAVRRLGLDDVVELLGWQSHPAVRRLYAESDVFVLPSLQESFGIAALEARCAGLPVVAMRRAGPSGFVRHEVEGLLADDDAGLAAQLVRLATDDRLRAAIARHNRTTRPAETWDVVLRRHEVVYAEAARLAAAPRPRRRPRPGGTAPLPSPLAALAALAPWTGDAEIGRTDERRGGPRRPRR
jgi:glycosyltransferase involved in cell wall biosynthesis